MSANPDSDTHSFADARHCPTFDGHDPSDFDVYRKRMTWWLLTQTEADQDSGATTGRIVNALQGKAQKILFDAIGIEDLDEYKKKEGIKKLLDFLQTKCGVPKSEDLQNIFREFFFKSRIRYDERFSDWLTRFELVKKKVENKELHYHQNLLVGGC